ncbi:MAG: secretin N-terminal domain-containing protein [Planctomycetota bacterium]|jgi:type II secretory pathway component GspD/PulD (secretin)
MRTTVLHLVLAAFVAGGAAHAQDNVKIAIDKDLPIQELIDQMATATGKSLLYDPNGQRIRGQKVGTAFTHAVPKEKVFDTFRSILAFYELSLVPVGPRGYEVYLVLDSRSTNNFIKNKSIYVSVDDVEKYADKDGVYISTSIPLKHIRNTTVLRTALSTMVSPAGIGRVHEVAGAGQIIIMDFAPTVAAMVRIVHQMDVEPERDRMVLEVIELKHAPAAELAKALAALFGTPVPTTARRGVVTSLGPPRPRVQAYASRNSLLVEATGPEFERIRKLVARIDVALPKVDAAVEVWRLKHVRADVMQATFTALLEGGMLPLKAQVVADQTTNTLIAAGDADALKKLAALVKQLDVAPM